ncbi:hypothetical protein [Chryseobacterium oryzae]|uniref:Uncharacterized protein n=1 Tax=Chryseobacterium oryzae TaxID=2929799 RepID=A0ABY4BHS7_9FLAO|nr:hypothetical protein [Chryseobacterium oryzae]UOE37288.1 hypothetical protein MTP08_09435 [Chryseobacterium oryzae]
MTQLIYSIISLVFGSFLMAQGVGINTNKPATNTQLHVDGLKDNGTATVGSISATEASNDFVITNTGQIGVKNIAPDASSYLDIQANNKGFMPPSLTTTERGNISQPETGLMIYNSTESCIQVNVGTKSSPSWQCVTQVPDNQKMIYNLPSYSTNSTNIVNGSQSPRGSLKFDIKDASGTLLTNLIIGHNGADNEGDLTVRTDNSYILNHVLIHGWQNATSNNKEGGGVYAYIDGQGPAYIETQTYANQTYYRTPATMYRGGASGGEFINYTIIVPQTGHAFRIFLTLLSNSKTNYLPNQGAGRYLIVAERFN